MEERDTEGWGREPTRDLTLRYPGGSEWWNVRPSWSSSLEEDSQVEWQIGRGECSPSFQCSRRRCFNEGLACPCVFRTGCCPCGPTAANSVPTGLLAANTLDLAASFLPLPHLSNGLCLLSLCLHSLASRSFLECDHGGALPNADPWISPHPRPHWMVLLSGPVPNT